MEIEKIVPKDGPTIDEFKNNPVILESPDCSKK